MRKQYCADSSQIIIVAKSGSKFFVSNRIERKWSEGGHASAPVALGRQSPSEFGKLQRKFIADSPYGGTRPPDYLSKTVNLINL